MIGVGLGICGRSEGCVLTPHLDTRPCVYKSDLSRAALSAPTPETPAERVQGEAGEVAE